MGNQVLDQKQLKSDQFTANYSKFLQNVGEKNESKFSQEEFKRAEGLYNARTESMKSGFKEVFNMQQTPEKVKHPDMTKFRQSLDDVKLERRMEKRGLLKSDVEVTNREEILGGKEVNRLMLREESVKHRDMTAGIRRELSYEVRAKAGDYDTLKCLSEFYPEMLRGSENKDAAKARFEGLLQNYGGQSQDEVKNKKQRFEALDDMTEIIMRIDLASLDLSSDRAIAANAAELERVSGMAAAFDKLINKNPDYSDELRTRKNEKGKNLGDELFKKMDVLLAVSDYYRVKKLLIEDETYTKYLNSEIGMDRKESDSFQVGRLKKLIRAAYYLGQNLAAKTRNGFMQTPLDVQENPYAEDYDELQAEDDAAMRLLSTDPSYEESFEKLKSDKVEALKKELNEKDGEFLKTQTELDSFLKNDGAGVEKYITDRKEKKAGYNGKLEELVRKYDKLKADVDYYSEEVRLIRDQMSFEYNLTQRERIDRVIYELEAERLFVPQRWIKMSPDVVEKREDPDFIYSTETKKNEYVYIYTKKIGRTNVRDHITKYKDAYRKKMEREEAEKAQKERREVKEVTASFNEIKYDGLPFRYAKPTFDHLDRLVDHFAGAYGYGYSEQEMMEEFDVFADACTKLEEIKKNPEVSRYYESAYKEMVRRCHLQLYGLTKRIANGLGDVPFVLNPVDMVMQMTNMLRTELMAMSSQSNPLTEENMRYVAQLWRDDPEGKCPVKMDEYCLIGEAYGQIPFGCQGYLPYFYNTSTKDSGYYTKEERRKITEYCRDYRQKHPDTKFSEDEICRRYALEHPNEFNSRNKLLRICENSEAEEGRLNNLREMKNTLYSSKVPFLQSLLENKKVKLSDPKKLLEYEKRLKKEHPELGWKGFKTDGVDDPFLIRRHLKNYALSPDEIRLMKEYGYDPKIFNWSNLYDCFLQEERKKKQKNKAGKK